ncbi:NAD(P)-binding protein [Archangium sp.]|uniref:NAD(P)-binding protein n=1 Tax=Archangium sp. TaxID=1872627 RepID=UPI002D2B457E|nr:NAD(P)-binding protein [Archangium sp.]HYO54236.1 NAD(P)-binding protein [Archangium sp.]
MSVIAIGGGISGMAVAFHLQERGPVVLLESSPRLSGNIQTHVRDGFLLERGPSSFVDDAEDESLARFGRRHFGQSSTSILLDAMQNLTFAGTWRR